MNVYSGRLEGKVAVVTGVGSGIGKGCALMFARHGARVMGCDMHAASAEETLRLARAEGLAFKSIQPCDVSTPSDVESLMKTTVEQYDGIDILVNAAAFGAFAWIQDMDYETQWKKTLVGELDVVFLACKAAWPYLIERGGGSIVNFASANAYMALTGSPALAHCAGKGGVLAMTRQLALEGAPHGIRANSISPGLVITGATKPVLDNVPGFEAQVLSQMMMKRLGQPEDVAWCPTYLASDEASWVTGSDIRVDGGATVM
jgi:NAD(P)-dependent dehydrogenase (short-subunit alcohol dehydrogenase family)